MNIVHEDFLHCGFEFIFNFEVKVSILLFFQPILFRLLRMRDSFFGSINITEHLLNVLGDFVFEFFPGLWFHFVIIVILVQ